MNPSYQSLYDQLLIDIQRIETQDISDTSKAEECFWIAQDYWEKLKELVTNRAGGIHFKIHLQTDESPGYRPFASHHDYWEKLKRLLQDRELEKDQKFESGNHEVKAGDTDFESEHHKSEPEPPESKNSFFDSDHPTFEPTNREFESENPEPQPAHDKLKPDHHNPDHPQFPSEPAEIHFFKNTKPLFTHYIEYYILLSEALLCEPKTKQDAARYWQAESKRFHRFAQKHHDFIRYYDSGDSTRDREYFLRENAGHLRFVPKAPVYDVDTAWCTAQDQLVRSYKAQARYYDFVIKRLEALAL